MPHLDLIRQALARHQPDLATAAEPSVFASVAIIMNGPARDPSVLFIERARRRGDRWSGQMAFPGGRVEAADGSLRSTAERETLEEVGVDLTAAEHLGRLDDQAGRRAGESSGLVIAVFAYYLDERPALTPNDEVREAIWARFSELTDPNRRVDHAFPAAGSSFPGILIGEPERHVVWGLTRRILERLLEITGETLP